jgi:hypothetical protein
LWSSQSVFPLFRSPYPRLFPSRQKFRFRNYRSGLSIFISVIQSDSLTSPCAQQKYTDILRNN